MIAATRPKSNSHPFLAEWSRHSQIDVQRGRLWDSIHYAPGAVITRDNSQFFKNVGPGSSKTTAMTNMLRPATLYAPEAFLVERVILAFGSETAQADSNLLIESSSFVFWMGCKYFIKSPLIALPRLGNATQKAPLKVCLACRSVSLDLTCTKCGAPEWEYLGHAGDEFPTNGDMDGIKLVVDLTGGGELPIENQVMFWAELDLSFLTLRSTGAGGNGLKLWTILEGWHARSIQ